MGDLFWPGLALIGFGAGAGEKDVIFLGALICLMNRITEKVNEPYQIISEIALVLVVLCFFLKEFYKKKKKKKTEQ